MCLNILRPAGQMRIVFVTGGQVMIKSRYWRRHFYSLITHNHQGLAITLASSLTSPIIVIVHKTVDKHLQPWHMSTVNCDHLQHSAVSRYRHNYPLSPSLSSPWQAQGFASQEFPIHLGSFTFPWCCHPRRGQAIYAELWLSDARPMPQINVGRETLRWAAVNRLELPLPKHFNRLLFVQLFSFLLRYKILISNTLTTRAPSQNACKEDRNPGLTDEPE